MSASKVVEKQEAPITQKEIFRLAATLFANMSEAYSSADTQLQIIELTLFEKGNKEMSFNEIAAAVLEQFKYHISEDEIIAVIARNKDCFCEHFIDGQKRFALSQTACESVSNADNRTIDYYIDQYAIEKEHDRIKCKDTIHRYLYELTTTNINSYQVLLSGKKGKAFSDNELTVVTDDFSEEEIKLIKDFLDWENEEKNEALGNIVFCCLEYCLLVNGDSPNKLLKSIIRHREIYLDTNVIFRALGIDGSARKKVVTAFLDKCKQANLEIIISSQTKTEFEDAINHYISQIKEFPRGDIYLGAYEQVTGYNFFSYYEEWRQRHKSLPLDSFKIYIDSAYRSLVSKYDICDNERIPSGIYNSDGFKESRNSYTQLIRQTKQSARQYYDTYDGYSKTDSHDATVIRYIELKRELTPDNTDIFLVSSDKVLRYWDMTRAGSDYPVVIYPSQLFLLLIKLCGRSENDYDSFVSFINIRPKSQQISPEKANIIISGISVITEDLETQKLLVSSVFNDEFQDVLRHSNTDLELYENTKEFSAKYLDEELKKKESVIKQKDELIERLSSETEEQKKSIAQINEDYNAQSEVLKSTKEDADKKREEIEQNNKMLRNLSEKIIERKYVCRYTFIPIVLIAISVFFIFFIILQFFFTDKEWNFAVRFYEWASSTYFGQKVGDFVYLLDAVFFGAIWFLLKKLYFPLFNKEKRKEKKEELIEANMKRL